MHIVYVTPELAAENNASGGLAGFTVNIARIFANNGHQVTIILASTKKTELVFDKNINLVEMYVPKRVWELLDRCAKLLARVMKKETTEFRNFFLIIYKSFQVRKKISEINRKNEISLVHYPSFGVLALLKNNKIPHVIRISSLRNICRGANNRVPQVCYEEIPLLLDEKIHDYVIQKCRYIISPSNLLSEIVRKHLNSNVIVIESPFLFEKGNWDYSIYNGFTIGKKYIIYYGGLRYLKGIKVIADIAEKLLELNEDIFIVLAGNSENVTDEFGNTMKAHELVMKSAGEYVDRVIYVGRLVREQLYPLIENAELCLLPSRIENLSNACIEAMAMGKIVVATEGASYEQLIEDKVSGFLCERDNSDSYLQSITEALNLSGEEKQEMSMKAKKSVQRLQPERIYEQYLEYYEMVIKEW